MKKKTRHFTKLRMYKVFSDRITSTLTVKEMKASGLYLQFFQVKLAIKMVSQLENSHREYQYGQIDINEVSKGKVIHI
jgi:hypothetical protein